MRYKITYLQPSLLIKKAIFAALLIAAFCLNTKAQYGANDPTFNPTDIGFGSGDGTNFGVTANAIQSDSKIIIVGAFSNYNGTTRNRIARLNIDGTLDTTFNSNIGADNSVSTTAIQSDGKIIIAGDFTSYNGITRNHIARLNADGTLDIAFNPGSGPNSNIITTTIQNDGKIIIGGLFTSYNGTTINHIARLLSDGTLDLTFNPGTGANDFVRTTAIQNDGKIIIAGEFTSYNGTIRYRVARLNVDGTLDFTFNPGTGANNNVFTTAIQNDGKIIICGAFTSYNGTQINRIARLNTDGTLDATFNSGTGADNSISTIAIQSDGKIIIGGLFYTYNEISRNRIARLNVDGTIDTTFYPGGMAVDGYVRTTAVQSDGKIIIGGNFISYNGTPRNNIACLNADGTLDATFSPITASNGIVRTTAIQSDGKIIIGGYFTYYNETQKNRIARLNIDGTLDSTFNIGGGANSTIYTCAIQNDGKIIIGGDFYTYNGTIKGYIARLNVDGTLDDAFNSGTGANNIVCTTAIQSDGKIIIGGYFTSYNGTPINHIARLNVDGTLDVTFNPSEGANISIHTIAIQSDGKIIIGGNFTTYNGTSRNKIARLNANGTLDASFNPGTGANNCILTTAIQSNGKIIIGGDFTSYNGTTRNYIACLNTNGTLDATFNPGLGLNDRVNTTLLQSDGKIIVGGWFTNYNGTPINRITRLNTDGTLDPTFNPGTGANSNVWTTAKQNDVKIIIGGAFTSYNGTGRNRVARIITSFLPAQPSVIIGSTTPCVGSLQNYSVTNVAGVFYTWSFPTGWTQTGGGNTNSVSVIVGSGSGNISVIPSNIYGNGTAQTIAVTPTNTIPAQPSVITGSPSPCHDSSQNYSVTNVAGNTYTWTFPTGWTQTAGGTTNSITVTVGAGSGIISVTPSNTCGNGTAQTVTVTPTTVPAQPSAITGLTSPCQSSSQNYSVSNVAGNTYTWTFPTGWTQTGGGTTNSVIVTVGAGSGIISATPSNTCGNGTAQTLAVNPNPLPAQPGTITGNTTPLSGTSENYSVTNVAGVSYTWTFPAGWVQTGGGNTNIITVTVGGSGDITCTPSNVCGNGIPSTLAVSVNNGIIRYTNNNIKIQPNPVSKELNIEIEGNKGQVNFEVLNLFGQVVFKGNMVEKTTVQTANFVPGVYLIKVGTDKGFEIKKIIKE